MYIKITKITKGQAYYHLLESYRHNGKVKQRKLMSFGKADNNCIPINDVKRVKLGISDTCKNGEKENLGKDRYRGECTESYGDTEYKDFTQDLKN